MDLRIGAVEGGAPYLFNDVESLTRDDQGRIYVGDSGAMEVRAFDSGGTYLFRVGGPGEGPGEFPSTQICGLIVDPDGRLWVNVRRAYMAFRLLEGRAIHERSVSDPDWPSTRCGNPMFVGPTGLTVPTISYSSQSGPMHHHAHIADAGAVQARIRIQHPEVAPWGDWLWPVLFWRRPGREPQEFVIPPPFPARRLVVHAPSGGSAYVFTPDYDIHLFNPAGQPTHRIRRVLLGPLVTPEEARSRVQYLDEQFAEVRSDDAWEIPEFRAPERKPPLARIWFDEDSRLWAMLWPAEGDMTYRAHVYDEGGAQMFTAEWPAGITLSRGGVSGDVALGVELTAFDVQRVVRLRFAPVDGCAGSA